MGQSRMPLWMTILAVIFSIKLYAQQENFNLDLEKGEGDKPAGWIFFSKSNYNTTVDTTVFHNGKQSYCMEGKDTKDTFGSLMLNIPVNFTGTKVKISGYFKTEDLDGHANLFLRADPNVIFRNLGYSALSGTNDWTYVEIEQDVNISMATNIILGVILTGEGKLWIDNFSMTIDGTPINEVNQSKWEDVPSISSVDLTEDNIQALYDLGLVWGFTKYYHPDVRSHKYDWDTELLKILPKYLAEDSKKKREKLLANWIVYKGEKSKDKDTNLKIHLAADLDWIEESNYSKSLLKQLRNIKDAKRDRINYYATTGQGGYISVMAENAYKDMDYPELSYRLVSLFRYWNIIQYYFPYRYAIGEDWKGVLKEFIPKFVNASNGVEYRLACQEIVCRIHDTHANTHCKYQPLEEFKGKNVPYIELTYVEDKPVVTGGFHKDTAYMEGMQLGDQLTKVNGKDVEQSFYDAKKYVYGSNEPTQRRNYTFSLLRTNDSILDIEYLRNGKKMCKSLKTYPLSKVNMYSRYRCKDTCFKMIDDDIAYINIGSFKKAYIDDLKSDIMSSKGLILDMRYYPGDYAMDELGALLVEGVKPFYFCSLSHNQEPGNFYSLKRDLTIGNNSKEVFKGKIAIIINECTQSNGEFCTMAYQQAEDAVVIGSTTAGADGNIFTIALPGAVYTSISGIGIYYPDGRETQRIGIVPDIEVKPTIEGVKQGRDELVEKAIEVIRM